MDFGWVFFAILGVLAFAGLALAFAGRRNGAGDSAGAPERLPVSRESAAAASRLLSLQGHAEVYGFIARGNRLAAVQAFRRHTRLGLRNCVLAVESMEKYPQPYVDPSEEP